MADDMAATEIIAAHREAAVRGLEGKIFTLTDLLRRNFHLGHCGDGGCIACEETRALLSQSQPTAAQGGE
jgi:hypothetical protein